MTDGSDDHKLARDMIDVHGREAATVARGNARAAAVSGQAIQARSWIRVLGIIQRQRASNMFHCVFQIIVKQEGPGQRAMDRRVLLILAHERRQLL